MTYATLLEMGKKMKIPVTRILAAIIGATFAFRNQYWQAFGMLFLCAVIAFLHMVTESALRTRERHIVESGLAGRIGRQPK